jgi:hypothetical protein
MVRFGYRPMRPEARSFNFELPFHRGDKRKSDLGDPALATQNEDLASAPSLADETVE